MERETGAVKIMLPQPEGDGVFATAGWPGCGGGFAGEGVWSKNRARAGRMSTGRWGICIWFPRQRLEAPYPGAANGREKKTAVTPR